MPIYSRDRLKNLADDFLKTYGWFAKSLPTHAETMMFSRPTGMGVTDELLVYFHEKGEETRLGRNLKSLSDAFPLVPGGDNGRRFFLSNAPLGPSQLAPVSDSGFKYQVPVWFFDREIAENWETPLKAIEEEAKRYESERISQPFEADTGNGDDLLKYLLNQLADPKSPNITVVLAPAGYGKTVLMSSLYKRLKDAFIAAKSSQKLARRPLMMLPGHVKRADDLDSLINNFVATEYEYGVASPAAFRFWITEGLGIWLLDGLEELILKNPEVVYQILDEYIYSASNNSQVVISIRKPLLATSPELKEVINEWRGSGVTLYSLADWGTAQRDRYFEKNLQNRAESGDLIRRVNSNEIMKGLCKVPYYCSVITELQNERRMQNFGHDTELVEYAFERICEREFGKGLDEHICPVEKQRELFAILVLEGLKGDGKFDMALLREWADVELPQDLAYDVKTSQLDALGRHALLSVSGDQVDFVNETLRQLLIGEALSYELALGSLADMGLIILELDSFLHRYLQKKTQDYDWDRIIQALESQKPSPGSEGKGFRNTLNVYLSLPLKDREPRLKGLLANTTLAGVRFESLNLEGFNFHNSKLFSTEFQNCALDRAEFDGCHFKDTLFADSALVGASIKDATLESIRVKNRQLFDLTAIQRFFMEETQVRLADKLTPCQATINLRKLFEKLIRKGKGHKTPLNFITNTKLGGGVPAQQLVALTMKEGYLAQEGPRVKVKINLFDEVQKFTRELGPPSSGIKGLLDATCLDARIGCPHLSPT